MPTIQLEWGGVGGWEGNPTIVAASVHADAGPPLQIVGPSHPYPRPIVPAGVGSMLRPYGPKILWYSSPYPTILWAMEQQGGPTILWGRI